MSCTRGIIGGLLGATVSGGIQAGISAASGAIGAAILHNVNSDYNAGEGANMGAIGGAILGGAAGFWPGVIVGASGEVGLSIPFALTGLLGSNAVLSTLTGLIGYGILNNDAATETLMNLGQTAASFALGGAVFSLGMGVVAGCCVYPIAAAAMFVSNDKTPDLVITSSDNVVKDAVENSIREQEALEEGRANFRPR